MTATIDPSTIRRITVVGVFATPQQAEGALADLREASVAPEQVSVLAKDTQVATEITDPEERVVAAGATGAIAGSVLGGMLGLLVGAAAFAVPGVGPVIGTGLLLSTLAGAGLGAASAGLIAALTELGVPEEEAAGYQTQVGQGGILLTVQATTEEQARAIQIVLVHHGGVEVRTYQGTPI